MKGDFRTISGLHEEAAVVAAETAFSGDELSTRALCQTYGSLKSAIGQLLLLTTCPILDVTLRPKSPDEVACRWGLKPEKWLRHTGVVGAHETW